MYIYAKCINTSDYFNDFLTVGESYFVKPITKFTVQMVGDDGEYHLVNANLFKEEREDESVKDRKEELLKACLKLLNSDSEYAFGLRYETIYSNCPNYDGFCLIEDIKKELGIED